MEVICCTVFGAQYLTEYELSSSSCHLLGHAAGKQGYIILPQTHIGETTGLTGLYPVTILRLYNTVI
jgi:hypothetical protein